MIVVSLQACEEAEKDNGEMGNALSKCGASLFYRYMRFTCGCYIKK